MKTRAARETLEFNTHLCETTGEPSFVHGRLTKRLSVATFLRERVSGAGSQRNA